MTFLLRIIKIMVAEGQPTQGARESPVVVLTWFFRHILLLYTEQIIINGRTLSYPFVTTKGYDSIW